MMMMDGWGHGFFGVIWMILFWGVIIGLPIAFVWLLASRGRGNRADARTVLEERYARGEIDEEEFERRKSNLDRP